MLMSRREQVQKSKDQTKLTDVELMLEWTIRIELDLEIEQTDFHIMTMMKKRFILFLRYMTSKVMHRQKFSFFKWTDLE